MRNSLLPSWRDSGEQSCSMARAIPENDFIKKKRDLPFAAVLGIFTAFWCGVVAQLVERLVRNEKVAGSIPVGSTKRNHQTN